MSERANADEDTLIARALKADGAAFSALVTRYEKALYNIIYSVVRNHEVAQEIKQETFLRSYQYLDRYGKEYKFSTWLFRIGVNLAITRKRREKLEREILSSAFALGTSPGGRPEERSPAEEAVHREETGRLVSAIEKLPTRYRKVLILRYKEGLSCTEIGQMMETSANSVSIVLHRAKERLRSLLAEPEL